MRPHVEQLALLAQVSSDRSLSTFFVWIFVLILGAVAAGLVILWVRRRLLAKDSGLGGEGLMENLRAMRDSGRMSPEEYDAARRALAHRISGRMATGAAKDAGAGAIRGAAAGGRVGPGGRVKPDNRDQQRGVAQPRPAGGEVGERPRGTEPPASPSDN